jgi:hypothetical protein
LLENSFLDVICKFNFYEKRALSAILAMAITNSKEVLMEGLAHVRCQNEVVLVFLICIVNAESFSGRVGKSSDDVFAQDLGITSRRMLDHFEGFVGCVFNPVVVINSLVLKRLRLWNHSSSYQPLNWT